MDPAVVKQLNELNRAFYEQFAASFTASRAPTEPGLQRALSPVRPGDRFLDLGCGPGRVVWMLPPGCHYVGGDFSTSLLARAREKTASAPVTTRFVQLDLLSEDYAALGREFDWILLRAVLHHIPGAAHRRRIVTQAAQLLAPRGRLILANWQFLNIPRLRKRVQPWETIHLTPQDVEPGDYLLDWRRDGYGLRYVHLINEAETRALAEAAGLRIGSLFRADGHTNDLTLYAVLRQGSTS